MHIYLIRHGESLATLDPSVFGRMDPLTVPLTQWGNEQARDAGAALRQRYQQDPALAGRTVVVANSPLTRVQQSADAFLETFGRRNVDFTWKSELLHEREHGEFNGLSVEQQQAKNPEIMAKLNSPDPREQYETPLPGGESMQDVDKRMQKFFHQVKDWAQTNQDVVVISHGTNLQLLERYLTGKGPLPDGMKVQRTGDVIDIEIDGELPGKAMKIHEGKKRPATLPQDYKTAAYDPNKIRA